MKLNATQSSQVHVGISYAIGICYNAFILSSPSLIISKFNQGVVSLGIVIGVALLVFNIFFEYIIRKVSFLNGIIYLFIFPFTLTLLIVENPESSFLYICFLFFLFYFLNLNFLKYIDCWLMLTIASAFCVAFLRSSEFMLSESVKNFYFCVVSFIIYGSYNEFKAAKQPQDKVQKLRFLGGAIAHELRTPLSAIILGNQGLQRMLPEILASHEAHLMASSANNQFKIHNFEALKRMPASVERTAKEAMMIIDMLLAKVKNETNKVDYSIPCEATTIIENVLREYPFRDKDRELITFDPQNSFKFKTNPDDIKYVFFNLLKNAIYQIDKHDRGNIHIWFESDSSDNEIHVKDTAMGIPDEKMIYLFDDSLKGPKEGTGIGLPFCKMIVENSGGTISCRTTFREYAEFIISFPKINTVVLKKAVN